MSTFNGFGTMAIHMGQNPEQWEMNQVVYMTIDDRSSHLHLYDIQAERPWASQGVTFASGLAAASALLNLLKPGDHLIALDNISGDIHRYLRQIAGPHHGIETTFVDMTKSGELEQALKPTTKIVWLESPSNPLFKVIDIRSVVAAARTANPEIIVVADNTIMTPFLQFTQRPLSLGADVVIHSVTKYINGHSDVVMGCAMSDREDVKDHLFFHQKAVGAVPSPFDCFLVTRGIKTLHLRMKAHYENAIAVAEFLDGNEHVEKVLYPALPSHPQHEVHKKQTRGMSGMLAFYLRGGMAETQRFFDAIKVFTLAESLGDVKSLAALPSRMSHAPLSSEERDKLGITDNLIRQEDVILRNRVDHFRLSVGIEDKEDLIADLENALKEAFSST